MLNSLLAIELSEASPLVGLCLVVISLATVINLFVNLWARGQAGKQKEYFMEAIRNYTDVVLAATAESGDVEDDEPEQGENGHVPTVDETLNQVVGTGLVIYNKDTGAARPVFESTSPIAVKVKADEPQVKKINNKRKERKQSK